MALTSEDKKIYTNTLIESYNANIGSLCHYYTKIESKMLEVMVIMKHHFDKPQDSDLIDVTRKYESDNIKRPLSIKMKKSFDFIERFDSELNKKYQSTYDDCDYLRKTRDKLAHREMVFDGTMISDEDEIVIKLRQIGYFGKQEEFKIEDLYNLTIGAPATIKSLENLLKELRSALAEDLPSLE